MKRTLIATLLGCILISSSAWSAKTPPSKNMPERKAPDAEQGAPARAAKHAYAKAERGKSKSKRAPASAPKFICEEPEIVENQQALVVARFLNDKCDPTRTYTVTMTNPGSTYPITICCVIK
jgi:hypothetical protein